MAALKESLKSVTSPIQLKVMPTINKKAAMRAGLRRKKEGEKDHIENSTTVNRRFGTVSSMKAM